jgi:hypothetical protein
MSIPVEDVGASWKPRPMNVLLPTAVTAVVSSLK